MSGFLDISFQDDNTPTVEEAYILTKDLPGGFTVKAGRFLSGIGYINERHAHDWMFSDAPLPYRAFLNNQYGDDGLQVRWLAPTEQFLEFGAEAFRGDAYPAAGARNQRHGHLYRLCPYRQRHQRSSSSWLAAASYLHSDAAHRAQFTRAAALFTGTDRSGHPQRRLQMGAGRQSHGAQSDPDQRSISIDRESGSVPARQRRCVSDQPGSLAAAMSRATISSCRDGVSACAMPQLGTAPSCRWRWPAPTLDDLGPFAARPTPRCWNSIPASSAASAPAVHP